LNLEPKNSGIFSRLQHQKNQAVTLMNFVLLFSTYVLKYALSFMVQVKKIGCCILGRVYQMRVARP